MKYLLEFLILISALGWHFVKHEGNESVVTDIDGNTYGSVLIGKQTWLSSNLRVLHYCNGDPIVDGTSASYDWGSSGNQIIGAYTFPDDDSMNDVNYGKYYNIAAINDSRKICPGGWHIPSDAEWQNLEFYEGMAASDTGYSGGPLRGNIGAKLLIGGNSRLNLQMAGYLLFSTPGKPAQYQIIGKNGNGVYWTSTFMPPWPPLPGPTIGNGNIFRGFNIKGTAPIMRTYVPGYAASVRCIKN